jgi:hypothetical protein
VVGAPPSDAWSDSVRPSHALLAQLDELHAKHGGVPTKQKSALTPLSYRLGSKSWRTTTSLVEQRPRSEDTCLAARRRVPHRAR